MAALLSRCIGCGCCREKVAGPRDAARFESCSDSLLNSIDSRFECSVPTPPLLPSAAVSINSP